MGADLFMRHREYPPAVRQRLKPWPEPMRPPSFHRKETGRPYQTTAVQPVENRNRRPRRIAAMAAACALLLTGTALLPLLLHRSARPGGLLRGQRQQRRFFLCASRF